MATKLENLDLEVKHFKNVWDKLPDKDSLCMHTVETLLNLGLLQVSSVFEHCISKIANCDVVSLNNADLSDGSDAKMISVRTSSYGKSYTAPVSGIYNKTGELRVQCYERKQDTFYYFVIPRDVYAHIPKNSNIEIPFEIDGEPRRVNNCKVNWWWFEVKNFEEMCNTKY